MATMTRTKIYMMYFSAGCITVKLEISSQVFKYNHVEGGGRGGKEGREGGRGYALALPWTEVSKMTTALEFSFFSANTQYHVSTLIN